MQELSTSDKFIHALKNYVPLIYKYSCPRIILKKNLEL